MDFVVSMLKTRLKINVSSATMSCLLALGLSITSLNASAHNPNTATLVLSETDGNYLVQLEGALTGVEAQINETYSPQAYKTAEQFKSLANEHFVKSLTLAINDQPITVVNPKVQLGHGTQFTARAQGVPKAIESIDLTNIFFKDLHGNKMTVVFLSEQFPSTTYVLNDANQHHLSLTFTDGQWQRDSSKEASDTSHSHDASANDNNADSHSADNGHENVSSNTSADTVLDKEIHQVLATTTQIKASKPLSSSAYVLGIGALIASLIGMLWFVRKES